MPTHRSPWIARGPYSSTVLLAICCACCPHAAQSQELSRPDQPAVASAIAVETMLEPKHTIELGAGERFAVRVPLRVSAAVNLGSAELRISLAPDGKHDTASEEIVLIAHLESAHTLLGKGDQSIVLHGVVPEIPASKRGAWHADDYSIRLGSGDAVNIGTPDEEFIDTQALAGSLTGLHLKLSASKER